MNKAKEYDGFNEYFDYIKSLVYQCKIIHLCKPLEVYLELTNACNLSCIYCYKQDVLSRKEKREIPLDKIMETLDELKDGFLLVLEGGEPFLHSKIFEILDECRKRGIHVDILTNGTMFDEARVMKLQKVFDTNLFEIQISLDGVGEDNELNRTSESEKVIAGIKLLNEIGIKPRIQSVITKYNYKGIGELLHTLHRETAIQVITMNAPMGKRNANLQLSPLELKVFENSLELEKDKVHFEINNYVRASTTECSYVSEKQTEEMFFKCTAMRAKICIDHLCNVYPCVFYENYISPIGNVKEQSLMNIWESEKANEFRRWIMKRNENCIKCTRSKVCPQKCMIKEL